MSSPTPSTPQTPTKAIVGLIGSLISFVLPFVLQVSAVLPAPWPAVIGGVAAVLTALGIYKVPNKSKA